MRVQWRHPPSRQTHYLWVSTMFSSHLNSTALIRTSNLIPATGQRAGARWRAPGALRPGCTTLGTYVLESYKYST